jgi:hypothetical protein
MCGESELYAGDWSHDVLADLPRLITNDRERLQVYTAFGLEELLVEVRAS